MSDKKTKGKKNKKRSGGDISPGTTDVQGKPKLKRQEYERALKARPGDSRLIYERDQLWKRLGVSPARRLKALRAVPELVNQRDDLVLELATLHNQLGQPERALEVLKSRQFQPWEGGEGEVSRQYERANVLLGRAALKRGDATTARARFQQALNLPENLGEARHLLVNSSDVRFWLGEACAANGDRGTAREHWRAAAATKGDFQGMQVQTFSEMTAFSARALERLGRPAQARKRLHGLRDYAVALATNPAEIDYFATSLPAMSWAMTVIVTAPAATPVRSGENATPQASG